jgi:small-conductance mechanosensitive channel
MTIIDSINAAVASMVAFLPNLISAIIILIIAWIVGRALGAVVSQALDRVGVDNALKRTILGRYIESSGTSIPHVFDLIVRWTIYIIGFTAAVNVLGIATLTAITTSVVMYIPSLIAALIVLIVGFILADFVGDFVKRAGVESGMPYIGIFSTAIQIFLYFIVIIIALDQLKINTSIIYVFATALAWGVAIGAGVGLGIAFGIGLKDKVPKLLEGVSAEETKQKLQKIEETTQPQPEPVSRPSSEPVSRPGRKPGAVPE